MMVRIYKHKTGCAPWSLRLPRLTALPDNDPERVAWEQHAKDCAECRQILVSDRQIFRAIQELSNPAPAGVANAVLRRLRNSHSTVTVLGRRPFAWGLAGTAAGFMLGILLTVSMGGSSRSAGTGTAQTAQTSSETAGFSDDLDELISELSGSNNGGEL